MTVFGILITIPLVSPASSTGERLETRNAVNNRPCIVGACASPHKNRLHTERQAEKANIKNGGDTMEEKKIEKLYELLERAERERDTETAAALRWAIFQLENR